MLVMLNISVLYSLLFSISQPVSSVACLMVIGQKFLLFANNLLIKRDAVALKYYCEKFHCGYPKIHVSNLPHKKSYEGSLMPPKFKFTLSTVASWLCSSALTSQTQRAENSDHDSITWLLIFIAFQ